MPEITVLTDEQTTPDTNETSAEEFEVTREWVESLFAGVRETLSTMVQAMGILSELNLQTQTQLAMLSERIPANLTQMISSQQETITSLVSQSMQTVRDLLSPPAPPVEPAKELPSVEVESPALETKQAEQTPQKRRKI